MVTQRTTLSKEIKTLEEQLQLLNFLFIFVHAKFYYRKPS